MINSSIFSPLHHFLSFYPKVILVSLSLFSQWQPISIIIPFSPPSPFSIPALPHCHLPFAPSSPLTFAFWVLRVADLSDWRILIVCPFFGVLQFLWLLRFRSKKNLKYLLWDNIVMPKDMLRKHIEERWSFLVEGCSMKDFN